MNTDLPGKDHYAASGVYLKSGRIFSYAHQINEVLNESGKSVLEVGKGPGIVCAALRSIGVRVSTLDMQKELEPDLVGSVTQIPVEDGRFDVSLCCQVLEHLPFDQFGVALTELRRVTSRALVLSLPDITSSAVFKAKVPRLGDWKWEFVVPKPSRPKIPQARFEKMGHFWEIGYAGTEPAVVRQAIERSQWEIARTWRVPELTWHRFFLLKR